MTKLYHRNRGGYVWLVAVANGITYWLYPKAPVGHLIR